jgi:hypothetical protein
MTTTLSARTTTPSVHGEDAIGPWRGRHRSMARMLSASTTTPSVHGDDAVVPWRTSSNGTKAMTQTALASVAAGDDEESDEAPRGRRPKSPQTPWPKTIPDQAALVRDLVLRGGEAWTAADVAARFRGAGPTAAAAVLDTLAALGLVVAYEARGTRTWRAARAG